MSSLFCFVRSDLKIHAWTRILLSPLKKEEGYSVLLFEILDSGVLQKVKNLFYILICIILREGLIVPFIDYYERWLLWRGIIHKMSEDVNVMMVEIINIKLSVIFGSVIFLSAFVILMCCSLCKLDFQYSVYLLVVIKCSVYNSLCSYLSFSFLTAILRLVVHVFLLLINLVFGI